MKIWAYRVVPQGHRPLADLVAATMDRPLGERTFPGAPAGMRLEEANAAGGHLHLDFARPRAGHGPGRMGRARPIEDIPMEGDDSFGEDTAMVYDPDSGFAAVQFNPFGPRPTAIQQYLNAGDLALGTGPDGLFGYSFGSCFRPEAFARLRDYRLVRYIDFTVSVPAANPADFAAGRSVGDMLRTASLTGGVQTVRIKMTAGKRRGDSLALDAAFLILSDLERMGGELITGEVGGKRTPDEKTSKVDLVDERVSAEREVRPNRGQRFARNERWSALRSALDEWRASGALR